MVNQGTWELYHDSFVNWALEGVAVNLQLARDYEAYRTIAETLIHEGLRELDLASLSHDSAYMPRYYDQLQPLIEAPWRDDAWQETLFRMALSFHLERDGALTAASAERIQRNLLDERLADADARIQDANESLRCESEASAMKDELIARQMQTIADLGQQLAETQHAFDCVVDSRSFAIGRAATALPRKLRDGARGNHHG